MFALRKLFNFLVFSNIYVAFPVGSLVLQTYWIAHHNINWSVFWLIYCATLFIYNLHRTRGLGHLLRQDLSERHEWAIRNKRFMTGLTAASFVVSTVLIVQLGWKYILYALPALLVTFGYTVPFIPSEKRRFRLRDIAGIKAILIALSVAYLTVIFPSIQGGLRFELILLFLERFLFILAITIPFDIRDFRFDAHSRLKTFPVLLGIYGSKWLSSGLLTGAVLLSLFQLLAGGYDMPVAIGLIVSYVVAGVAVWKAQINSSEYYYSFFVEGTMLLQGGLIYLAVNA